MHTPPFLILSGWSEWINFYPSISIMLLGVEESGKFLISIWNHVCSLKYKPSAVGVSRNYKLGFTPCKAEQPIQGIELQEKEIQKD